MFMTRPKKVMTGLIWRHKQDSFDLSVSTIDIILLSPYVEGTRGKPHVPPPLPVVKLP